MKFVLYLIVAAGLFFYVLSPEQASAQLLRRWQEDNSRDNFSHLPGADPNVRRTPDYGAERVSEEIRDEVNGRTPVRPAPDFWSDAPLARVAKQYQPPVSHIVQRPMGDGNRVQPPRMKSYPPFAPGPHWLLPDKWLQPDAESDPDLGDLIPLLKELSPQSYRRENQAVEL